MCVIYVFLGMVMLCYYFLVKVCHLINKKYSRVRVRVRVCPGYDVKLYPSQIIGTNLSRIARRHFGVAVPGHKLAQACSEHKYHS